MNKTFFFTESANILNGRNLKVTYDDGDQCLFSFVSDSERKDLIHPHYSLIEDGIIQLIYLSEEDYASIIFDMHRNTIILTCMKQSETLEKKGSFVYINSIGNRRPNQMTNEEKAIDFWIRFFDQHDESAIDDYLAEPYIQHNPHVADGVEAFRKEFHERFKGDMKNCSTQIKRVSSRDDLVFIHNILKRNPSVKGHAAVDIFRFKNGRIIEHFDVIQTMSESSKNDHPMF